MSGFKLIPTYGNVLLRGVKPPEKKSGIILQISVNLPIDNYEVIAVADESSFTPGQIVVLARFQGQQVVIEGEEFIITKEESILGVMRDENEQ